MPPRKKNMGRTKKGAPPPSPDEAPVKRRRASSLAQLVAEMHEYRPVQWLRTGVHAIDLIIGQGIPSGRMVEVMGDPSTAKSAFGYVILAAYQRSGGYAFLLDSEQKTYDEFAKRMGVDFDKIGYSKADSIDDCVRLIGQIVKLADPATPTVIVWDSIASTPGAEEFEKVTDSGEKGGVSGSGGAKAERARQLSTIFRATLGKMAQKGVTLVAMNQLRTNFNFATGYTSLESTGGRAGKYHAAARLIMRPKGRIRAQNADIVTGIQIECEALKNTLAPPFRKAIVKFKFDTGFDTCSGLDELLLRHGRIVTKAGWLCYKDKSFRRSDMDRIVIEIPEMTEPLKGTVEINEVTAQVPGFADDQKEAPVETAMEAED